MNSLAGDLSDIYKRKPSVDYTNKVNWKKVLFYIFVKFDSKTWKCSGSKVEEEKEGKGEEPEEGEDQERDEAIHQEEVKFIFPHFPRLCHRLCCSAQ